ncbi:MAG: 3'-5' exonuclease [Alistipes sp.]
MAFVSTISNDEVAALEPARFDGEIVVVDTMEALVRACAEIAKHEVVGFDTETRPSFTAGITNKVALMQLSAGGVCYLIRLNRLPLDKALLAILQNPAIKKVGVAVQNDIQRLGELRRFKAAGFVDLQSVVGQFGIEDKSLRKLSGIVLGKKVSKAQRLSNWEAHTLTPQQQLYAATDAWVCVQILDTLQRAAKEQSRDGL